MPYSVTRKREIEKLLQALAGSHCASIVGLSNTGKSTLLRSLRDESIVARYTQATGRDAAFVYVDCNSMFELTGQGLYELILRSVRESVPDLDASLADRIKEHYRQIVEPDTQFLVPLSFNNAMTAFIEDGQRDLILLLDEFDEAFDALDGRVFLNLRALKDKYPLNLIYVTATVRRLGSKRSDEQTAEFVELSAAHTLVLRPFERSEADELVSMLAAHAGLEEGLSEQERDFLWEQTGGHPRLLRAALSHLIEMRLYEPEMYQEAGLAWLKEKLAKDVTVRSECSRLWGQLGPDEREALLAVALGSAEQEPHQVLQSLGEWGLIRMEGTEPVVFSELLAEFARRQHSIRRELPGGVWVDGDSGDVWVDGMPAPPLTELEFRLLSLLFERMNKLTDKYQIVETVWGVSYIDDVDDARIEKLISRLRAKIEPDPGNPRYIITVRGRGYKLVG
ncbi:MAG TPA: hypothetical protein ENI95_14565 [Chloroflexi bacterium]|nr:hypothetical protein [Chloroflexota bacterium]